MNRLGVHYLVGDSQPEIVEPLSPPELLAGLAAQTDARMRLALIPVLLQHPELSNRAKEALDLLKEKNRITFQLYYTAAHYLQLIYDDQLQGLLGLFEKLPDLYSDELKITKRGSTIEQLKCLARRHQEISGLPINWYGTYTHAARRTIDRMEKEREWALVHQEIPDYGLLVEEGNELVLSTENISGP